MIEFGKTLREAREAKGLTVRQLAEMTRMAPMTIQELESENFSRIAAPIYGRGFVKLYCEVVGIDPKPLVNEFMDIYNGNRETTIRERPIPDASEALSEPAEVTAAEPPPPARAPVPSPEPVQEPEPDLFQRPLATDNPVPEAPLSRYAAPIRHDYSGFDVQAVLRIGTLAVGALGLLAIALWGIRSVYRATNGVSQKATPAATDSAPAAPRTPQKVPSLYID